jgi:hypothetical protein
MKFRKARILIRVRKALYLYARSASHWTTGIVIALIFVLSPFARSQSSSGDRDVASWREPGVKVAYSSFLFRSKKANEQIPCPVNRGPDASDALGPCHWSSNQFQHLPQWIWVRFGAPRRIDKVVLHAASMTTSPVDFYGQSLGSGDDEFHTVFHVRQARFDPQTLTYAVHFAPLVAESFRLVIERTAAAATPQSWSAELAQLEVFGVDAPPAAAAPPANASAARVALPHSGLYPTGFVPQIDDLGQSFAISTPWYRIVLDKSFPRILFLALDSLGKGELGVNLLDASGAFPLLEPVFQDTTPLETSTLSRTGNLFRYAPVEIAPGVYEEVSIRAGARGFDLSLAAAANRPVMMRGGLFRFHFAANQTPTTFVCHPSRLMNYVEAPTYLAAPDFGTAYITRTGDDAAFYRTPASLFPANTYWVDITPHQPATEDGLNQIGPQPWHTTLHFAVQKIEPLPELLSQDPRLERFPKYSLNMTQWRPDTGILSNSVMSIDCGLAILFYAEQAVFTPHLQDGISPMALVEASVDRYFNGARGYMMPNLNVYAPDWKSSRETPAYLVISAWYVIRTIGGMPELNHWLKPMEAVANHIEAHFDQDGLVNEAGREWFDVYDFQGPDAFSNAADYRAFLSMADVETLAGRPAMARRYRDDAARIKAVYFKTFFNPATGVLAGWKSPDGKLHDYMFPWVNGFAIYQGLVPAEEAKSILQTMLTKMQSIGFQSFQLGLPTNLVPMSPSDYVPHTSGAPKSPDGTDTWQIYMNGGATAPYEYYFIQALYQNGLVQDAERLLWPLMQSYETGTFNAGIELPGLKQRNPAGSAFYEWSGLRGRGEGYLPEDWQGVDALFTGHFGIGFDQRGYFLEPWSPLKAKRIKLDLPYMGRNVPYLEGARPPTN